MEFKCGNQDHEECPRCGETEDTIHVLTCRDERAALTFTIALQKLDAHMRTIYTAPETRLADLQQVSAWRQYQHWAEHPDPTKDDFSIWQAMLDQDAIG